ncbi:MAG TPA: CHASE domain-containing protein, partial [Rheinheimera sp.]|nr:CHASE domain-containing protein [Rheinheimera sp.]
MLAATLIGLCATLLTYVTIEQHNLDRVNAATASRAEQLASLAQERFGLYEYGLLGARGAILVGGAEAITRPQFEQYINSRSSAREFPGALGFGFVRRVPVADENAFVQRARADGMPDFTIRTLTPHNEERFVIEYIYPIAPNKQAIGLDIGSETNRRNAAIEAALTGSAQLTAPITLVQAEGAVRHGFLILLPVYKPDAILITPADRLKAVIGWSYAPLVVEDVLTGLEQTLREVNLSITDMADNLTFFEHQGAHSSATYSDVTAEKHISFMGRQWKFTTSPTAELINELNLASTSNIAIAGIGLTIAVVFLLFASFNLKQKDDQSDDFSKEISVKTFLASMAFKKTIFAYCVISVCFIIFSSLYFVKDKFADKAVTLNEYAEYTYNTLASTQHNYIKDL